MNPKLFFLFIEHGITTNHSYRYRVPLHRVDIATYYAVFQANKEQ